MDYVTDLIREAGQLNQGRTTLIMLIAGGVLIFFFERAPPLLRTLAYVVIVVSVGWFGWLMLKIHLYGVPAADMPAAAAAAPAAEPEKDWPIPGLRFLIGPRKASP